MHYTQLFVPWLVADDTAPDCVAKLNYKTEAAFNAKFTGEFYMAYIHYTLSSKYKQQITPIMHENYTGSYKNVKPISETTVCLLLEPAKNHLAHKGLFCKSRINL